MSSMCVSVGNVANKGWDPQCAGNLGKGTISPGLRTELGSVELGIILLIMLLAGALTMLPGRT